MEQLGGVHQCVRGVVVHVAVAADEIARPAKCFADSGEDTARHQEPFKWPCFEMNALSLAYQKDSMISFKKSRRERLQEPPGWVELPGVMMIAELLVKLFRMMRSVLKECMSSRVCV